jgi:Protein of unknown function (DUF1757)
MNLLHHHTNTPHPTHPHTLNHSRYKMFARPTKKELDELYELGYEPKDIPKDPKADLTVHVLRKGFQVGSLVGLTVAPLYLGLVRRVPMDGRLVAQTAHWSLNSAGFFTLVSAGMLAMKWPGMDMSGFVDRAYRLRHNKGQCRTDQFSMVGMGMGALAASMMKGRGVYRVFGGATIGSAIGVLAHVGLSLVEQRFGDVDAPLVTSSDVTTVDQAVVQEEEEK